VTRIVAVTNQKGGVAKTTTAASLGAALAELDMRVLLVDLDPQACLTFSLGVDPESLDQSVAEVLVDRFPIEDAILSTTDGVDLLPATIDLAKGEAALLTRTGRELTLRMALDSVTEDYDWVLLDSPPSLGVLTVNALSAAREVLVPLQCETLSHRGLGQLLDTIEDVRRLLNPRLHVLGVLPTLYDGRTVHARLVLEDVASKYGLPVLSPPIPKSVRFAEAPAVGRSILSTSTRSRGAAAYREVAAALVQQPETAAGKPSGKPRRAAKKAAARQP
jgi:chromosome partitioning protein